MSGRKKDDEVSEPGRQRDVEGDEFLVKGENQGEDTGDQPRTGYAAREDKAEAQARQDLTNDEWKEVAKTFDTAIFKEGMEAAMAGRPAAENPYVAQHQHDSWEAGYARVGQ